MAVGPGGVPAGIDPSLLTSAAFELGQVGCEIIEYQYSLQCNDNTKTLTKTKTKTNTKTETKTNTKTETETKTGTR